jgi:serine/threonine-protein kinase
VEIAASSPLSNLLGVRIDRPLAEEDEGRRFAATDPEGAACEALVLRPELATPAALAALEQATAAVRDAAVAGVHGRTIVSDGEHALALGPELRGECLATHLGRRGRLPWDEALAIAAALGRRLSGLHHRGLVFGGLRPTTVWIDSNGAITLRDVGLARNDLGPRGAAMAAPEQVAGGGFDAAADIYALASLLYALASGRPLFTGALAQVLMMQRFKEPPPLRRVDPTLEISTATEAALLRALDKRPARRFASIDGLLDALTAARRSPDRRGPDREQTAVHPLPSPDIEPTAMIAAPLVSGTLGASRPGPLRSPGLAPAKTPEASQPPTGGDSAPVAREALASPEAPATESPPPPQEGARPPAPDIERTEIRLPAYQPPAKAQASGILEPRAKAKAPASGPLEPLTQTAARVPMTASATEAYPGERRPEVPVDAAVTRVARRPKVAVDAEATALLPPLHLAAPAEERTAMIPGFGGARLGDASGREPLSAGPAPVSTAGEPKAAARRPKAERSLARGPDRSLRALVTAVRRSFRWLWSLRSRLLAAIRRVARLILRARHLRRHR